MSSDFSEWLNKKLRELNTDEGIFGTYITGILEGDETLDEKRDALEGILAAIIVSEYVDAIQWSSVHQFHS